MEYERLKKEDRPVLAVCYDFDRTLSPDDMQAQGFIQSVGENVKEFWRQSNELAKSNDMDMNLAYMLTMVKKCKGKFYMTREKLAEYGAGVKLYDGVKKFKKIYASSFAFDEYGVPEWPAQTINYTNKTQFLFRIEKGCLDINDHGGVNEYIPPENIRVPLRNIVYLGDSDTDIPCMKLVNSYGGHSIGVYDGATGDKSKVYSLLKNNRIRYFAPADYTEGSEIDRLVKAIIDKTAAYEKLEQKHVNDLLETRNAQK